MSNVAANYEMDDYFSREALFEENVALVKIIANHINVRLPPDQCVDDLIQVGMIGLLEASRSYDNSLGATFKSYASIRIRGAIIDELRRQSWLPRSVQQKSRQLSQAIQAVENKVGRTATDREIASKMDMSLDEYGAVLESVAGATVFSLDDENNFNEVEDDGSDPFKNIQDASTKSMLTDVIKGLPDQEKLVVALYYDEELNLREIGEVLDVSESRVCQIHSQAISRMRSRLKDRLHNEEV